MNKILLISQYFNYKETNSTAISIHSRISGIKDQTDITVYCFENHNQTQKYNDGLKIIETPYDLSIKDIDDKMDAFAENAFNYVKEHVEEYDLILLHSNYSPTHDLVARIKAISDIKIIIYMPDPYVGGPLRELDGVKYKSKVASEYSAYKHADKAIVTNEFFMQYMLDEYPEFEGKIDYVYHCYEDLDYEVGQSLDIIFLGYLYFGRKIENTLIAFDQLLTEHEELRCFRFVSSVNNSHSLLKTISQLENKSNFQLIRKRIPFEQASKLELNAYGIVNVALEIEGKDIDPYFPTKLAQAFKTGKPILSISKNDGLSRELMKRTNNYFARNEVEEIKDQLYKMMTRTEHDIKYEELEKFNTKHTSIKFLKIINDVINGR